MRKSPVWLRVLSAIYLIIAFFGAVSEARATVPGAPINVSAVPVAASEALITWSVASADVNNVLGFNVSQPFGSNSLWDPAARSFQYFVCPGKTVTFMVSAFNAEGSSPSVPASVTMPEQVPLPPSEAWAYPSSPTQITVSFNSAMSCNTTGYKIERASSSSGPPPSSAFTLIGTTTTSTSSTWIDTTPLANTRYYYRVSAYNTLGTSAPSPIADTSISMLPPSGISTGIASSTQIAVSWEPKNQLLVNTWIIERSPGTSTFTQVGTTAMAMTFYMDTVPGQGVYTYRVKGTSTTLGSSAYSPERTINFGPPSAAPSNLVVGPYRFYPGLNLSWVNNANNSEGTIVERATSPGGPFTAIFSKTDPLPAGYSDFDEQSALQGVTYYYRIAATNRFGDSAYSNVASGTYGSGGQIQPPVNLRVVN